MKSWELYRLVSTFRRRRMMRFAETVGLTSDHTVLDVGGTPDIWAYCPVKPKVTFLNVYPLPKVPAEDQITGDGCAIPVPDQAFDIAFSNSVIEHVGSWERQAAFARELCRVGKMVWLQTPDRASPLEPHTLVPFLHWLPSPVFRALAPFLSVRCLWDGRAHFTRSLIGLEPLSYGDVRALFPTATILREKTAFLPKSLLAFQERGR